MREVVGQEAAGCVRVDLKPQRERVRTRSRKRVVDHAVHARIGSHEGRYHSHGQILLAYLGAYVVVRYGLSALYLIGRPNVPARRKLVLFLFGTPAAILLNACLLVPTRYMALAKLFDNRWQTRELSAAQISLRQTAATQ